MKAIWSSIFLFLIAVHFSMCPLSAWTPHGYVQITSKMIFAEYRYNRSGERVKIDYANDFTQSFWGILKLREGYDLILNLPVYKHTRIDRGEKISDIMGGGDSEIGVRYKIASLEGFNFYGSFNLGIPLGGRRHADNVPFRAGDFNQSLMLNGKYKFNKIPLFISGGIGYRNRTLGPFTGGLSDNFLYYGRAGYSFKMLDIYFSAFGQETLGNGDNSKWDTAFLAYGPMLAIKLPGKFGLIAGVETAKRTKNTYSAPAYTIGISRSF